MEKASSLIRVQNVNFYSKYTRKTINFHFTADQRICLHQMLSFFRKLKVRVQEYDATGFIEGKEKNAFQEFTVARLFKHPNFAQRYFLAIL